MGVAILKIADLSIADLKAAYDFNEMKIKRFKKSLKAKSTADYKKKQRLSRLISI